MPPRAPTRAVRRSLDRIAFRATTIRAAPRSKSRDLFAHAAALPVPLTSFVGRDGDLAAARQALGATRLLTLTGAGGSGKTRLAVELACAVADEYHDGVAWVELGSIADPALVPAHVATTLCLPGDGPPDEVLAGAFRGRSLLLVLDNCEHVVTACASLVTGLLSRVPGLRVLATSREALGVAGERAWLVPVLSLPPVVDTPVADAVAEALESAAVRLFVERARDAAANFALTEENVDAVVQICRRLDGLPLAIELAAARVRALAPAQIAERLDDRFRLLKSGSRVAIPRHRTLREAMEWSYNLLDAREQLVLHRLSVFAGGFALTTAEEICTGAQVESGEVLDLVSALVDKSLLVIDVQQGEARYAFLETVRQYALERLQASGEEERVRDRHAAVFLALAESLEPRLLGGAAHPATMRRMDEELPNMRGAMDWMLRDREHAQDALRLGWAIRWYWFARGLLVEGRDRLEQALAIAGSERTLARGKALSAFGLVCWWQGDYAASVAPLEESLAILREIGDPRLYVSVLISRGMAAGSMGDHTLARHRLDEAVARADGLEPPVVKVYAWFQRGLMAFWANDHRTALESLIQAEQTARKLGHETAIAQVRSSLANLAYDLGEQELAMRHVADVLETARLTGERWAAIQVAPLLVRDAVMNADHARGARLLGIVENWRRGMGAIVSSIERERLAPHVAAIREALAPAAFDAEYAAGEQMSVNDALDFAAEGMPAEFTREYEILRSALASAAPALGTEASPAPPLRVRALGTLEVLRDGSRIPREAWRYARPREMLLYLLIHREGCTREQIGLTFWPEATAAQVKNNFHVTLHQVRKALGGAEWIVYDHDRYRVNWSAGIEFDAAIFEREVTAVLKSRSPDRDWSRLGQALALYRGDFLADEGAGDWHLDTRDHLRRLYVDGAEALAGHLMAVQEYGAASEVLHRLLTHEPLHERGYRQLLICHARLGERSEALRQYDRLVALLRTELEAEPEAETRALYQRIRRGEVV